MSDAPADPPRRRRFQAPRFPDGPFCMDNADDGFPVGLFSGPEDFVPYADDGSVYCQPSGERPVILRVIHQDGDVITTLDGAGREFRYRMTPVEDPSVARGRGPRQGAPDEHGRRGVSRRSRRPSIEP